MKNERWRQFVIQNARTHLSTFKLVDEENTTEDVLAKLKVAFKEVATEGVNAAYIDGILYRSPLYAIHEKRYLESLGKCK